jgi:glycosyltransferase involved in cell wall biosynthesis
MQPRVSVLMTAYNRETFIAEAIESVLAQTFTNFELIIVDDGSKDRTVEIARSYAAHDPRIRIHQNEKNLGQFSNRNHAASLGMGEFLKYHDSDDLMYPHCLQVMVPLLAAFPQAAFALSPGGRDWTGGPYPMLLTPRMAYQREFLGAGLFHVGPACALFRAEAFRRIGGFPCMGVPSDTIFLMNACLTEKTLLVPGGLFWYRTHPGQELVSAKAEREYLQALGYFWKVLHSPSCPLIADEREQAKRNWTRLIGRDILRDLGGGHISKARDRLTCSTISAGQWLRYFRRKSRNINAGTPRDENGDFVIPDWGVYGKNGATAKPD